MANVQYQDAFARVQLKPHWPTMLKQVAVVIGFACAQPLVDHRNDVIE